MNTCVTSARALVACLLASGSVAAEETEFRGAATLGADLYHIDSPWDDDDVSSFFDQYHYVRDKDKDVPWFLDVTHLDVGFFRDDDTSLVRLERFSPWAKNDRAELEVDWERLRLDLDYHRFRTDQLRVFPTGTFPDPSMPALFPAFGTMFNPDVPNGSIFDEDNRLFDERLDVGGKLRVRLDDLEGGLPWLTQVSLLSRFGRHTGYTQDRFLLAQRREPVLAPAPGESQRFRGNRRELDQRVSTYGGGLVFSPLAQLTGAVDVSYESFRENASEVTFSDLTGFVPVPCQPCEGRGFHFVPDTDRWTGDLKLAGNVAGATVEAGAFYTRLDQDGSGSQLQQELDLGDPGVDTWSVQGAFDLPLGESMGVNGFAKYLRRNYDPVDDAFAALNPGEGQVDPIYETRREFDVGLELTAQPVPGTRLAFGYTFESIDRDLDFADAIPAIRSEYNLLNDEARTHAIYARARTRLFRRLQLSGELSWMWAPKVSYPRDLERALSGKARASYTLPRPVPLTFTLFGDFVNGENDDISLTGAAPDSSRSKDFERTEWSYGATITAVPVEDLVLFGTFTQSRDEEEFDHLRSNVPRYFGPGVRFYTDSSPLYKSDVNTLVTGGSYPLTPKLDLSLSSSITWVRVDYHGSGITSTAGVLDSTNDVRSRISSIDARLDYTLRPGLRLGLGYRYDNYHQDHQHEPVPPPRPDFDDTRQTVTIDITVDLGLFSR
jgi:hypothetical protein